MRYLKLLSCLAILSAVANYSRSPEGKKTSALLWLILVTAIEGLASRTARA